MDMSASREGKTGKKEMEKGKGANPMMLGTNPASV